MVKVKENQILLSDIQFFSTFPTAKNSWWVFELCSDVAFELETSYELVPDDYLQNSQKAIGDCMWIRILGC